MRGTLHSALLVAAIFLTFASGVASYRTLPGPVAEPPDLPIALSITKHRSRLAIHGSVSSTAHEAILRQTAAAYLPGQRLEIDVHRSSALPPAWSLVTDMALRAVAATHSSTAIVDGKQVRIRAVVTDTIEWATSVEKLSRSLSNEMNLKLDVVTIEKSSHFERLCENLFNSALQNGNVNFPRSSADLGSGSLSLLDEIVEIAADCPSLSIAVKGYTDGTGVESANSALSMARAEAVVAYMIGHGIRPQRLAAIGAGPDTMIARNDRSNRTETRQRIAFELSFP